MTVHRSLAGLLGMEIAASTCAPSVSKQLLDRLVTPATDAAYCTAHGLCAELVRVSSQRLACDGANSISKPTESIVTYHTGLTDTFSTA